jgi:ABC-2 type transport system ATP-binding protein
VPSAIAIEGVSKRFRLYHERATSLKERVIRFRVRADELWALRDVSAVVEEGATLGLIGPNGSGKTSLLKIIAGILRPTTGTVTTRGRIAALLALGAGFHPELTGRENVHLNAAILGLSKRQTERAFDDIVGFAELEEFIDNQVKFYSSGMYVRLGFAVAVHVDPAILLVDEVLAVGDLAFQLKCLDRVGEFQREGRTIVFVSHSPELVARVCDSCLLLSKGKVVAEGRPHEVIGDFRRLMSRQDVTFGSDGGTKEIEIVSSAIFGPDRAESGIYSPGDELIVQMDLKSARPVDDPVVSIALHDDQNQLVYGTSSDKHGVTIDKLEGKYRVQFLLKSLPFLQGRYFLTLGVHSRDSHVVYHLQEQRFSFEVMGGEEDQGAVFIPVECKVERL